MMVLSRLGYMYDSIDTRDLVQIAILAVVVFCALRVLSKTGAASMIGRGLGLVIVALFLLAQVVVASLDMTELGAILDYVLITTLLALVILFQPEIRRGLIKLGRSRFWTSWTPSRHAIADPLADAAEALSRDGVGALIVLQREVNLTPYIESGEKINGQLSAPLIRSLFAHKSPLHDGAVIIQKGTIAAAACFLPLTTRPVPGVKTGSRHRAAIGITEDTDCVSIVVSEDHGELSVAVDSTLHTGLTLDRVRDLVAAHLGGQRLPEAVR